MQPKKIQNNRNLKDALELYLKHFKLLDGYHQAGILGIWEKQMDSAIVNRTESIKFKNGILEIKFNSSVLSQEMKFKKEQIKETLNRELGKRVIQEVNIF